MFYSLVIIMRRMDIFDINVRLEMEEIIHYKLVSTSTVKRYIQCGSYTEARVLLGQYI